MSDQMKTIAKSLSSSDYNPTKEDLMKELAFMYSEYEEVCNAYKKLWHKLGSQEAETVHDMSHMKFIEQDKNGEE